MGVEGHGAAIKHVWCELHVRSPHRAAKKEEFNAETADLCNHAFRESPKGCNSKKKEKKKTNNKTNKKPNWVNYIG